MAEGTVIIYSDGGARHNPGPAAGAYLLFDGRHRIEQRGFYLGLTTNNAAEYRALEAGLAAARKYKPRQVVCFLDSELVVRQLNGDYRVKNGRLRQLVLAVQSAAAAFPRVEYRYLPREKNYLADRIVNQVLDARARMRK